MNEMKMLMEMVVVKDGNDIVGRIASDMSGGIVISDDRHFEQWHISAKEIWEAYLKMRDEMGENE